MLVREIMSSQVEFCTPQDSLQDVARKMESCDCGAIPVLEDQQSRRPVGIVTDRDITIRAVAKGQNPLELSAGDVMSGQVLTVRPDTDLEVCLRLMEENQIRRMPVVDNSGRCCGIVAQADVAENASPNATAELLKDVSQPGHHQPPMGRFH